MCIRDRTFWQDVWKVCKEFKVGTNTTDMTLRRQVVGNQVALALGSLGIETGVASLSADQGTAVIAEIRKALEFAGSGDTE